MADTENQATNGTEEVKKEEKTNGEQTNGEQPKASVEKAANGVKEGGDEVEKAVNIYAFTVKDIDGKEVSLSKYQGHPILIVNVASNCGFTKKNYKELNELYEKYEKDGLRIVAFPCNQFVGQEPGCDIDIKEFAAKQGVKFEMMSKIDVNGATAHPLYKWLKAKQRGVLGTTSIKWNFTKFLVDKEGNATKRYSPTTSPLSIEPDLKALIG